MNRKPNSDDFVDRVTVYDKDGNGVEAFCVDAKELIASGEYFEEAPQDTPKKSGKKKEE